jgi:hypothetical protein
MTAGPGAGRQAVIPRTLTLTISLSQKVFPTASTMAVNHGRWCCCPDASVSRYNTQDEGVKVVLTGSLKRTGPRWEEGSSQLQRHMRWRVGDEVGPPARKAPSAPGDVARLHHLA